MIRIRLKEMMKKRGIETLAELIRESREYHHGVGIRRDSLMAMRDETLKKIDLNILDVLCKVLTCEVGDLVEHVPCRVKIPVRKKVTTA